MRKYLLTFIYFIIFFLILYFGYEAKGVEITNSVEFVKVYFDSFAKYLFIGTIIISPIIFLTQETYLNPEVKIRIINKMFEKVWRNNLKIILFTLIFIIMSFWLVSLIFKFDTPISIINVGTILRLSIFLLMCFVIREIVYLNTKKIFLEIAVISILNFIFLISIISYNFYININALTESNLINILMIYESTISFFGLIYLYVKMDKKEILK